MKENKLNVKQELFCKFYIESKGNGVNAYMQAYWTKNYETAKVGASRMITNDNISKKIYEKLRESWFNDFYIDLELLGLIKQDKNPQVKLRAIEVYNRLSGRDCNIKFMRNEPSITDEEKAQVEKLLELNVFSQS